MKNIEVKNTRLNSEEFAENAFPYETTLGGVRVIFQNETRCEFHFENVLYRINASCIVRQIDDRIEVHANNGFRFSSKPDWVYLDGVTDNLRELEYLNPLSSSDFRDEDEAYLYYGNCEILLYKGFVRIKSRTALATIYATWRVSRDESGKIVVTCFQEGKETATIEIS